MVLIMNPGFVYNFFMPLGFLAHLQKRKIKDLGDEMVQISKSVWFLRSIANLCFEELGLINLITKNQLSILSSFVTVQC